jgi:cytochrome c
LPVETDRKRQIQDKTERDMFDTMTSTKIIGGLCGTFLVFLLGNMAAGSLFHVGAVSHGAEEHAMAYPIEADGEGGGGDAETTVDFATLLASADAAKGEKVFGKCKACHKVDGSNGTGPHLDGVVGRDIGSIGDFGYSEILAELPGNWDPEELSHFLENPKSYAAGTKMSFAGLPKAEDRANLIAYLASLGG